jgi:cobalt-zinc-cadmium efflux system protein
MATVPGIEDVHDLHAWTLSSDYLALSAHLVLDGHPTLEEAQAVGNRVKALIGREFGIAHATLELECEACADGADPCAPVDASR